MNRMAVLSAVLMLIACAGCAARKLTPEMEKISSVSDTTNCKFINKTFTEAHKNEEEYYLKLTTGDAGGDSYKIISSDTRKVEHKNLTTIIFEIYKCK